MSPMHRMRTASSRPHHPRKFPSTSRKRCAFGTCVVRSRVVHRERERRESASCVRRRPSVGVALRRATPTSCDACDACVESRRLAGASLCAIRVSRVSLVRAFATVRRARFGPSVSQSASRSDSARSVLGGLPSIACPPRVSVSYFGGFACGFVSRWPNNDNSTVSFFLAVQSATKCERNARTRRTHLARTHTERTRINAACVCACVDIGHTARHSSARTHLSE